MGVRIQRIGSAAAEVSSTFNTDARASTDEFGGEFSAAECRTGVGDNRLIELIDVRDPRANGPLKIPTLTRGPERSRKVDIVNVRYDRGLRGDVVAPTRTPGKRASLGSMIATVPTRLPNGSTMN